MLAGCASPKREITINNEGGEASTEAAADPSREAVFVYGGQKSLPNKIILKIGGEPRLFSSGYLRLAGVVGGEFPMACLELGGRGFAAAKGEKIDDYRIVGIESDHVVLEK